MILYFTGTGNSEYAAKYIGGRTGDKVYNLFDKIKNSDYSTMTSISPWVVVAPTYCWQLPRIVRDWIENTAFEGSSDIYFVLTCGSDIGNAEKYLKQLCDKKNLNYKGCAQIVMPENYIAMFDAPSDAEAVRIIDVADRALKKAAADINLNRKFPKVRVSLKGKLCSSIVNLIYYPLIVKDKKFYAGDECTGCGLCAKLCPLDNISLEAVKADGTGDNAAETAFPAAESLNEATSMSTISSLNEATSMSTISSLNEAAAPAEKVPAVKKPVWHGKCTHCMACIAHCPTKTIEYGKVSEGKNRYVCPR